MKQQNQSLWKEEAYGPHCSAEPNFQAMNKPDY